MMTHRESILILALAIVLGCMTGLLYAGYGRPGPVQSYYSGAPVNAGYSVGPGYQMTEAEVAAQATRLAVVQAAAATPTSVFLQVPENVAWMIADAARNYYGERIGTLTEADRDNLFWQGGHTFELGVQITKRHTLGTSVGVFDYMVFAEGIIVQKQGDLRIGVISPHGKWSSYAPPLVPTPSR
jgi:hypothetical protein